MLVLLLTLTGCSAVDEAAAPVDPTDDTPVTFEVPSGASTTRIAEDLKDAGLIKSMQVFKMKAKELEADGKMQAGTYRLSRAMDNRRILETLVSGDVYVETLKVTIPEGLELEEILVRLEEAGLGSAETYRELLATASFEGVDYLHRVNRDYLLEGYLFPATYTFEVGTGEKEVLTRMLRRFGEVFSAEDWAAIDESEMSLDQLVTLASIVEREAKRDDERATIASVFLNRLDISMPLQSCATIQYALGERKERLLYEDLEIESIYNTYQNAGLPPAPIASPGEASLRAALYPEETEYLYFVVSGKGDGSHVFSTNLNDHNRAKARVNE
jgi:UPF0755 protein